ncbi:2-oxoacid:acceptor oxidoreductase family protein [Candidatus Bipolaricaulota bacterium]|nr:2-oxoacid:acceptor oxidoreductase family protein [Candidatus Bipolaricaulota bacterium]
MRQEIRFAGFGGQGIISAGRITGRAAVLHDGKHAVLFQSYGPEARGGACSAEVVVADRPVDYPRVGVPDAAVIMSQEAYEKFGHELKPGGLLLLDKDLVEHEERDDVRVVEVPATRIAESLGKRIVANVVMLGALAALWPAVSKEAMLEAILGAVPSHTRDLNRRAFEAGVKYVEENIHAGSK